MKYYLLKTFAVILFCSFSMLFGVEGGDNLSITVSPLHLIAPIAEVTAEYNLGGQKSIAGIAGYGSITVEGDTISEKFSVFELGGQFRYYWSGGFDQGWMVGAELLWLHVGQKETSEDIEVSGSGLAFGPFVGYKVVTQSGFTFDSQIGFQSLFVKAEATDSADSDSADESSTVVLLNLNVGWTF